MDELKYAETLDIKYKNREQLEWQEKIDLINYYKKCALGAKYVIPDDDHNKGIFDGLELALSILESRKPCFEAY